LTNGKSQKGSVDSTAGGVRTCVGQTLEAKSGVDCARARDRTGIKEEEGRPRELIQFGK